MTKFKVGDRVIVYSYSERYAGQVLNFIGRDEVLMTVKPDSANVYLGPVHPKQCRRLKPKTRRRCWISLPTDISLQVIVSLKKLETQKIGEQLLVRDLSRTYTWTPIREQIEFIEVRRKK